MNNQDFLKQMGAKIRKAREAKGLYLRDLGKMCNLHPSGIGEIENGKRNSYVLTLKLIAEKLEVDVKRVLVILLYASVLTFSLLKPYTNCIRFVQPAMLFKR